MKKRILLVLILLLALALRLRSYDICDPHADRIQVAMGITSNLPPLYHYLSAPLMAVWGSWYAPVIVNILLAVLATYIMYLIGRDLSGRSMGLLLAFFIAINPFQILLSKVNSPETVEIFFIILAVFLFLRIEMHGRDTMLNIAGLFLVVLLGAFSKHQFIFLVALFGIYGLARHRLAIFSRPVYYTLAFAYIPYFAYLLSNPKMLSAFYVYLIQPAINVGIVSKMAGIARFLIVYQLLWLPFMIAFPIIAVRRPRKGDLFFLLMFALYLILLLVTVDHYVHYLILPLTYFAAAVVKGWQKLRVVAIACFLLYVLLGFFFYVPNFSILTNKLCELNHREGYPVLLSLFAEESHSPLVIKPHKDYLDSLFMDEQAIIVSGYSILLFKYTLPVRQYHSSILNDPGTYEGINYAIISQPIDTTYQGVLPWDYEYNRFLIGQSEVLLNITFSETAREEQLKRVLVLKIVNKSADFQPSGDVWERSLASLNFNGSLFR